MPDKVARLFERKLECLTLGAMDILLLIQLRQLLKIRYSKDIEVKI